jgi:Asp-tRNA(Asn)/Glu-tRNA(Gln) amidotransferase A subunit family amidase
MHSIGREVAPFFQRHDVLLTPATAQPPPRIGVLDTMTDDLAAYWDRIVQFTPFTQLANITGQPACSVPVMRNRDGLPIGIQLQGRYGDESTLLCLAAQLERSHPWDGWYRELPISGAKQRR